MENQTNKMYCKDICPALGEKDNVGVKESLNADLVTKIGGKGFFDEYLIFKKSQDENKEPTKLLINLISDYGITGCSKIADTYLFKEGKLIGSQIHKCQWYDGRVGDKCKQMGYIDSYKSKLKEAVEKGTTIEDFIKDIAPIPESKKPEIVESIKKIYKQSPEQKTEGKYRPSKKEMIELYNKDILKQIEPLKERLV